MKTTTSVLKGTDGEIARPQMSVGDFLSWDKSIEMQNWQISGDYQLQSLCIKKSSNVPS